MILTTRLLNEYMLMFTRDGFDIGLVAHFSETFFKVQIVPVLNDRFLNSEALLLFVKPGKPKTFKTVKSVISFADKHGIDKSFIKFMETSV